MAGSRPPTTTHLVVFIHGYTGAGSDFDNMERQFHEHYAALPINNNNEDRLVTHKIQCNSAFQGTFDGIERASVRIYKELMGFVGELQQQKQQKLAVSFVGHSLGGLYARYVCRLLDECQFFAEHEPRFFVTFASPHMSARRPVDLLSAPIGLAFQTIAQRICRTTQELFLEDGTKPLLLRMTEDHYLESLQKFRSRVLYANVCNDFQVHYSTASISMRNPYGGGRGGSGATASRSADFPSMSQWSLSNVHLRLQHETAAAESSTAAVGFTRDDRAEVLQQMFHRLNSLSWERYDCVFHSVLAHEQIINKRDLFAGKDVVCHLVSRIMFPVDAASSQQQREQSGL